MNTTTLVLQIVGPLFLTAGLGLLINKRFYSRMMDSLMDHVAVVYFISMFTMILGLLIVLNHNIWGTVEEIIVSVIGWLMVVKAAWMMLSPTTLGVVVKWLHNNSWYYWVDGSIAVILGAYIMQLVY